MQYSLELSLPVGVTFETCSPAVKNALRTLYESKLVSAWKEKTRNKTSEVEDVGVLIAKVHEMGISLSLSARVGLERDIKRLLEQVLVENSKNKSSLFQTRKEKLRGYLSSPDLDEMSLDWVKVCDLAFSARECICTSTPLKRNLFDD